MHVCSNLYLIILNLCKHYTSKNVDGNFVYYITGYIHSNLDIFSPALWRLPYTCFYSKKTLHSISQIISSLKGSWSWRKAQHTVSKTNAAALSE